MKTLLLSLGLLAIVLLPISIASAQPSGKPTPQPLIASEEKPLIQVAVLLDTSNSMDGLINQAKSQLWKLVSELARARRGGQIPKLEVALYEYGNDGLPGSEGHIRQVVGLTTDLDKISEDLFALTTNGGSEFCGHVIDTAITQLPWSKDPKALKIIFIAGNEPFTQGSVDYRKAVKKAISQGVVVNTIFCGDQREGIEGKWQEGALLADGQFSVIDSNRQVAHIAAPQDAEIERLGQELNKTYIAYGRKGKEKAERQKKQDTNAASVAQGASVQRSVAKASKHYKNAEWDLVDAAAEGVAEASALDDEALPEEMVKMNKEERKQYIDNMAKKRAELQEQIQKLDNERRKYVETEQKKQAEQGNDTFDKAVIGAIKSQAAKKSFSFE